MFTLRCALRSLPKGQKVSYISRCYGASIPGLCESKDPSSSSDAVSSELIYEGRYWKSLRRIRRVSLGSCSTGLVIVPLGLLQHSDTLSVTGQLSILAVTVATCVGTTLGLKYLSHPYVAKIYSPNGDKYPCERLNIFGNLIKDEFDLSKISKTTAFDHPFCNFKYDNKYFYVATPELKNESDVQKFDEKLV